ncbi:MAG: translation initiation factor IF-2 [Desulfovibrio sp.]|nr:translation initiation factor IF-2 [Desulfovibrio sp.]
MSDEKKKVKDLAVDLGLSPREVLAAAKDLGITAAKVAASSLFDAEASRLREHFSPGVGTDRQEVIVRRRRKEVESAQTPEQSPASAPVQPPLADAPPEASPPPARQVNPVRDFPAETAKKEDPATAAEAPAEGQVVIQPVAENTTLPDEASKTPSPVMARIVRYPATVSRKTLPDAASPPEAPISDQGEATMQRDAPVVEEAQEHAPLSPKKSARVVHPAAFSAEPERGADGMALSSAPALSARADHGESGQGSDDEGRQASQVRVISLPNPRQTADRPRAYVQDRQRPAAHRPRPGGEKSDGRPGLARPESGAPGQRPGGSRPAPSSSGRQGGFMPRPPSGAPGGGGFAPLTPEGEQGRKKRQKGRRTVEFIDHREKGSEEDVAWGKAANRRMKPRKSREQQPVGGTQPLKAVKRKIKVDEFIRVSDLAHQMALKSGEIIKVLFNLGVMATINQSLDIDTAILVAGEFGYEIEKTGFSEQDLIDAQQEQKEEKPEDFITRPPVVTIMGHVDHGKTSLLDAIRKSSVVSGEAGGITQHIGAYHVKTKKGEIVFLDTPGHEAFTAMRARGAEVTDIVVLVVAADDGVMEQTKEAINHARAAGVPIMVAVNKMDKEAANPDRVKRELAEQGLVAEDWGGETTFSYVSAKTRTGLDDLLELLALQAEILELKANPKRSAVGHIIEAKLDKGRGSLGTVLIQQGTLRLGDSFVCGVHSGRVRAMFSDQGKKLKDACPSMPVEVQGFEGVPEAGEEFICIADEKTARRIAESRALKQRERELAKESRITLETFLARKADSVEAAVLNLVVKADVRGSLEAITDALNKLSTDKVRINVIHGGTGGISESDVLLATASGAIIIGFNVRPSIKAKELAEQEKVDIRFYDIIYKLVEEIKNAMEGMLAPVSRELLLGNAEVREIFSVPKAGQVAGCHVSDGKAVRGAHVRLLRDGIVVHTGRIASLRRFKDDVREVAKGYECGIGLDNYNDVKAGDVIEVFEIVEEAATL